jgi:hypothetical protein
VKWLIGLVIAALVVPAGCPSSSKNTSASTPVSASTKTTLDIAGIQAWYSRYQADVNALVGTTNALKNDRDAALNTDCALGRTQIATVRRDLDDPLLHGNKREGSLRRITVAGLDQLDEGFALCMANDMTSAVGHVNAGIRLLNPSDDRALRRVRLAPRFADESGSSRCERRFCIRDPRNRTSAVWSVGRSHPVDEPTNDSRCRRSIFGSGRCSAEVQLSLVC